MPLIIQISLPTRFGYRSQNTSISSEDIVRLAPHCRFIWKRAWPSGVNTYASSCNSESAIVREPLGVQLSSA
jgi:hypothetical protein